MLRRGDAEGAKRDNVSAIVLSIQFHVEIQFVWRLRRLADFFVATIDYKRKTYIDQCSFARKSK